MNPLKPFFEEDPAVLEIGVDEVGRGPLFGRVYTAAVILPKDASVFDHTKMKDSKRFHSKKRIEEAAEYIKEHAISWSIAYEDEKTIDDINILQATQSAMHKALRQVLSAAEKKALLVLVDGNYFKPLVLDDGTTLKAVTVVGGDNTYSAIAAASILAKVARDKYIEDLCAQNPDLVDKYRLDKNKGYGTKAHIDGILEHGLTQYHRKSFSVRKVNLASLLK